jgi:hypothetical protein
MNGIPHPRTGAIFSALSVAPSAFKSSTHAFLLSIRPVLYGNLWGAFIQEK